MLTYQNSTTWYTYSTVQWQWSMSLDPTCINRSEHDCHVHCLIRNRTEGLPCQAFWVDRDAGVCYLLNVTRLAPGLATDQDLGIVSVWGDNEALKALQEPGEPAKSFSSLLDEFSAAFLLLYLCSAPHHGPLPLYGAGLQSRPGRVGPAEDAGTDPALEPPLHDHFLVIQVGVAISRRLFVPH